MVFNTPPRQINQDNRRMNNLLNAPARPARNNHYYGVYDNYLAARINQYNQNIIQAMNIEGQNINVIDNMPQIVRRQLDFNNIQ
jgi:hypothetical protein